MVKNEYNFKTSYDLFLHLKELYGDLMYRTGIYKFYFIEKPQYFYVGMASRINKTPCNCGFYNRWKRHLNDLDNKRHANTFIQNMYNVYGFNSLRFEFLEFCDSKICPENEIKWFGKLKPPTNFQGNKKFKKSECLPNGVKFKKYRSGFKHSEDTKQKISKAQIGRIYTLKIFSKIELDEIIKLVYNGETLTILSKNFKHDRLNVLKQLLNYVGAEDYKKLIDKSYKNSRDKITRQNILRIENKNEKYKDIIPVIINKYRSGLLISEIRPFVGINEDLIGILIKDNISKEELKIIKSKNAIRKKNDRI